MRWKDGKVAVCAVDEKGERLVHGYLLKITERGVVREKGVNPDLGFPLDEDGRLKLV